MNGNERWESIEPLAGDFRIGHSAGALCYLIDDQGRARSEGYHKITVEKKGVRSKKNYEYFGERGAFETRINPIPEQYL